jgi:dTDP-glucose 4,6-dehydratase
MPLAIVNMLHGKPLPIYGDGRNVRDWLHVSDHCRGIDVILARGIPGETYNIGGRCERENLRVINALCAGMDDVFRSRPELRSRFPECPAARDQPTATLIRFVADRPGHDRRYAIDCGKIERELQFTLLKDIDAGLRETLHWYLDNETWWRSVMDGTYRQWIQAQYGS